MANRSTSSTTTASRRKTRSTPSASTASTNGAKKSKQALDLVMRLMAIPGKSCQEGQVVQFILEQLRTAGATRAMIASDNAHKKTPMPGEVGNLMLRLPGTIRKPTRMLMAHMDTVPICVGARPVRKGDTVTSADAHTGLGGDDRAGVAVILNAAIEILRRGLPHPPLTFLWLVQEEVGLHGARHVQLAKLGKPALAFNWDGGAADKLTIGATGGYRLAIEITGLASHAGGAPEQGVSAIAIASLAIADLVKRGWHGLVQKGKEAGTSNVGVIQGGDATNVVTDRVQIRAEARSHNPAFRVRIVREIEQAFERAAREVQNSEGRCGEVKIDGRLDYESFRLDPQEPCVQAADAAVRACGGEPMLAIANGGLDANWMTAHGIPTVTLGCGQANIHMCTERLDLPVFQQACQIALRLATDVT